MEYFDPVRPKIGGRPALLAKGKPVGVLPVWNCFPTGWHHFQVTFNLMVRHGVASQFHIGGHISEFRELFERYISDPEGFLSSECDWKYEGAPPFPPPSNSPR